MMKIFKKALKKFVKRIVGPIIVEAFEVDSRNIQRWRQRQALVEAGKFVEEYMRSKPSFRDDKDLLTYAISCVENINDGLVCEFGVASGTTINHIASVLPNITIYGFDSFEGLPEDWRDGYPKGIFKMEKLPKVSLNVRLVKGLISDTLPLFLKENQGKVVFLHIDVDLYSSTKTIFKELESCIKCGTVIVFDELFNYPGWQNDEYKAFMEFIERTGFQFEYLGYCRYRTQVAIKIK